MTPPKSVLTFLGGGIRPPQERSDFSGGGGGRGLKCTPPPGSDLRLIWSRPMYVVHLGRLKAPRKAAGQMDLLTVPSADSVDSKVIQVEEALSASSRDR